MILKVSFRIEHEPKAQKRPRFGKGFVYDPSRREKQSLRPLFSKHLGHFPETEPVAVTLAFYKSIRPSYTKKNKLLMQGDKYQHTKTPDVDNMVKFYLDCLPFNDKVIYRIEAEKYYSPRPRVEITVETKKRPS
jgi:Holliday junction resolvase RusA-like endonuclease|tara:strand:- start:2945 stop:3346 length:402 start_codon:yes stop_codon:yes gene_type:complete